jgi:hypothetical protein
MTAGVKKVMEGLLSHVKFDKNFVTKVIIMDSSFVNKNEEHTSFFGGTLTGVHRVRFLDSDRDKFFTDLLQVNDLELEQELHALPDINTEYHVSSDVFNITSVYLLHALTNAKNLNKDQIFQGKMAVCNYMQYRFLTSVLIKHFIYAANPDVAEATYNAMTLKFLLRQHGSWAKVIQYRSQEIIKEGSIWFDTIKKLDNDKDVVDMINNIKGAISSIMKAIYDLFLRTHAKGTKISGTSATFEFDGETILKDKEKGLENYTRYALSVVNDKNTFIKQELLTVMESIMPTTPPNMLVQCLEWVSNNYQYLRKSDVNAKFIETVLEHAYDQFKKDMNLLRNKGDLVGLMGTFKGLYTSSKTTDEKLLKLREQITNLVKKITNTKDDARAASVRTSIMLYIILRTFTMGHFSN